MSRRTCAADVFISHASEDKDDIARPLAEALRRKGLAVWYDDYALRLGDSLRQVIDKGLSSCRFGVVILSPAFFSKEWPQRELNGLLARETRNGAKVLLPVWHKVSLDDVVQYSPLLADKLAVSTSRGLQYIVEQILEVIELEMPAPVTIKPPATYLQNQISAPMDIPRPDFKSPKPLVRGPGRVDRPTKSQAMPSVLKVTPSAVPLGLSARKARVPARHVVAFMLVLLLSVFVLIWLLVATLGEGSQKPSVSVAESSVTEGRTDSSRPLLPLMVFLQDFQIGQSIGANLLRGIGVSLPELLWLDELRFTSRIISVKGEAYNTTAIANFVTNLDKLTGFSEPTLRSAHERANGIYGFSLDFKPEVPALESEELTESEERRLLGRVAPSGVSEAQIRSMLDQSRFVVKEIRFRPLLDPPLIETGGMVAMQNIDIRVETDYANLVFFFDRLNRFSRLVSLEELVATATGQKGRTMAVDFAIEIPVLWKDLGMPSVPATGAEEKQVEKGPELTRWSLSTDPFDNPRPSGARKERPEGIGGLSIGELELTGIFSTTRGYVAQVEDQRKRKRYILKVGDELYDGDVSDITAEGIILKRMRVSFGAREPVGELTLSLSPVQ